MITIKRGGIIYYIKDESVIACVGGFQYIAYTVYPLQNRKPFYDFRKAIMKSQDTDYSTPTELIILAQKFKLKGVASHKPQYEK
jgi:hypothetical protein